MLAQKIRSDMTTAMKARDDLRVQTLRGALAAFTNELVAKNRKPTDEVTDEEAFSVLKRQAKQRKDAAEQYTKGGRTELAEKELKELAIIEEYLPRMASREEIEQKVRNHMQQYELDPEASNKSAIGKLTGAVMKDFAGKADGADVQSVIRTLFKLP